MFSSFCAVFACESSSCNGVTTRHRSPVSKHTLYLYVYNISICIYIIYIMHTHASYASICFSVRRISRLLWRIQSSESTGASEVLTHAVWYIVKLNIYRVYTNTEEQRRECQNCICVCIYAINYTQEYAVMQYTLLENTLFSVIRALTWMTVKAIVLDFDQLKFLHRKWIELKNL